MPRLWSTTVGIIHSSSFIYLLSRIIPASLQLLGVTIFVRVLGQDGYGAYALVVALVFLVGNVGSTWLVQSILRFRSSFKAPGAQAVFGHAVYRSVQVSALLVTCVLAALLLATGEKGVELAAALLAALALVYFSIIYAERQSDLQPKRILIAEALRGIFTLGVPLAIIWGAGWRSYGPLLLGIAIGNTIGAVALTAPSPTVKLESRPEEVRLIKQFAAFGIPLTIWMGASLLLNVSDRYLIEWALGLEAVGTYSAMYDVVYKSTSLLLTPLLLASHPLIMRAWNAGEAVEAEHIIRRTVRTTLLLAVPVLLGWGLCAPFIVKIVLGAPTPGAAALVAPIAGAAVLWSIAVIAHKPLEMRNRTALMCGLAVIALGVQVLLNVLLLPIVGLGIVPWSTVASGICYAGLVVIMR